jgi:RNA-directed DNA polymerase
MQRKLSQWATDDPTKRFVDLYSLLCNEVWLRVAHHHVNTNQGRETAGIDARTMSGFNGNPEGNLERLRTALKTKVFEPEPVRRVYIPKANGKERPIGIPTIDDRIVQQALRMILEPIWEADFSRHSYGFRPNRSTYDAMTYIGKRLNSHGSETYQWVIEGDITSYFDTIPHQKLMKAVKKRVADRNIRDLLWKFLRAGVMYREHLSETLTGTPQGGIISPLLANIYLHQLDGYIESKYLKLSEWERTKRRKTGQGNYLYVRYADDFVVLCNGTKAEAHAMKEELGGLLSTIGLTLSEEKTKVTHITEGFDFLGYRIIRSVGTSGKMISKVLIPEKAIKSFKTKIHRILDPRSTSESTNAKIYALNLLTRGWCEYYRSTNSPSVWFGKLSNELYWLMAHWLGKKYELSMPGVMRKFKKGNTFGTRSTTMARLDEHKAKRFVARTWHNPYTEPVKVQQEKTRIRYESLFSYDQSWNGHEHRQLGEWDRREEAILLKGTICNACGQGPFNPYEVHVDHIVPLKASKDYKGANRMGQLQILCNDCHRAKTKSDLKVLSRMRRESQVRF